MSPHEIVGHFRVTGKLGEGGMCVVYRATDTRLNREVAIKVLPSAMAADADRMARFAREARVMASLDHPNIAAIYGVEQNHDSSALILALIEGSTLAERIKAGPVPLEEAVPILNRYFPRECDQFSPGYCCSFVPEAHSPARIRRGARWSISH